MHSCIRYFTYTSKCLCNNRSLVDRHFSASLAALTMNAELGFSLSLANVFRFLANAEAEYGDL